uniref:Uncharacterized protein n=1 Tax=Oryza meridionalis TaxID=40149 RepID=A0A0E0C422_9ORYZ
MNSGTAARRSTGSRTAATKEAAGATTTLANFIRVSSSNAAAKPCIHPCLHRAQWHTGMYYSC